MWGTRRLRTAARRGRSARRTVGGLPDRCSAEIALVAQRHRQEGVATGAPIPTGVTGSVAPVAMAAKAAQHLLDVVVGRAVVNKDSVGITDVLNRPCASAVDLVEQVPSVVGLMWAVGPDRDAWEVSVQLEGDRPTGPCLAGPTALLRSVVQVSNLRGEIVLAARSDDEHVAFESGRPRAEEEREFPCHADRDLDAHLFVVAHATPR